MKMITEQELEKMQSGGAAIRRAPVRRDDGPLMIEIPRQKQDPLLAKHAAELQKIRDGLDKLLSKPPPKQDPLLAKHAADIQKIRDSLSEMLAIPHPKQDPLLAAHTEALQQLKARINAVPPPVVEVHPQEAPKIQALDATVVRDKKHRGDYKPIDSVIIKDDHQQEWEFKIIRDTNVRGLYKPVLRIEARVL